MTFTTATHLNFLCRTTRGGPTPSVLDGTDRSAQAPLRGRLDALTRASTAGGEQYVRLLRSGAECARRAGTLTLVVVVGRRVMSDGGDRERRVSELPAGPI